MTADFATLPPGSRYRLANATLPAVLLDRAPPESVDGEGLVRADIIVDDGRIAALRRTGEQLPDDPPTVDLDGGMVWPGFVDMHVHLDKGHIWSRQPNPDGSFEGALDATERDRSRRWTAEDVAWRMDFALRCAYAHGSVLVRTHIDSLPPQHAVTWPVFSEIRERWAGRIDLQAVSLTPIDMFNGDEPFADEIVAMVKRHEGVLGAVTFMVPDLDDRLDDIVRRADKAGLDLDFHVDETNDPDARSLRAIADAVTRNRYAGRVVVGHCCSLAVQDDAEAQATIAAVAEAGLSVVSLPLCNLYLQDRSPGRTPRWRGVTLLHEMTAAGVRTAVASDNTRDPFYAYGDLDMLEVFREAVRIGHLDHPIADAPAFATSTPADILDRPDRGRIAVGGAADLVLFRARSFTELLARPQADRMVVRAGRAIDRTLPDYRELDELMMDVSA